SSMAACEPALPLPARRREHPCTNQNRLREWAGHGILAETGEFFDEPCPSAKGNADQPALL
ncbi:hypothetical protein, partial [Mesorhizobium sp. M7A.F.Ca.US.001.02.1.1]|uniref:hypothetical protein n=1 Tax=Mesorhizobium sp. M7A.F.Ca.US.001.02.1.1 TaxID=2496703 RepID=UPI0019D47C67